MHELCLALSILEIVEQEVARRCGDEMKGRVTSVTVRVGSLSGVEPEALSFAWEVARGSGSLRDTALSIELVEARASCEACGTWFLLGHGEGSCPTCGPAGFKVIEGRELEVRRIVLEMEEADCLEDGCR